MGHSAYVWTISTTKTLYLSQVHGHQSDTSDNVNSHSIKLAKKISIVEARVIQLKTHAFHMFI